MLCRTNAAATFLRVDSSKLCAKEHDLRSIINPYQHRDQRTGCSVSGARCAAAQVNSKGIFAYTKEIHLNNFNVVKVPSVRIRGLVFLPSWPSSYTESNTQVPTM